MTTATRGLPCQDAGSSLPYDAIDWANQANAEVSALFKRVVTTLASVAGTNTITATAAGSDLGVLAAYAAGQFFSLIPANTITGAATLNIDGLGAKNLKDADGNALTSGGLLAGRLYIIHYNGTDFRVFVGGARPTLSANRTYYVRTDGSDSNTGLVNSSSGAFLTLNKFWAVLVTLDLNGFIVTCQVGDGTYAAGLDVSSPWTGGGAVVVQGNLTRAASCLISGTSINCFNITCTLPGSLTIQGFKVATATTGVGVRHVGVGTVTLGLMDFGACGNYHMLADNIGARILCSGNYIISGAAQYHYLASGQGQIFAANLAVTIIGSIAFSFFFGAASRMGLLQAFLNSYIAVAVAGGGSGYAVGDTITLAGGTQTTRAVLTVMAVSGGAVTEVRVSNRGVYTALPSNPVSQQSTSGGGSGATFTMGGASPSLANGSWTNPSTVTGTRYNADINAAIFVAGGGANALPGNAGGSTSSGGTYA